MNNEDLTLNVIDEMDLFYYLDLLIYKAKQEPASEPVVTIDQVF